MVAGSVTVWPATVPVIVGATVPAVAMPDVVLSAAVAPAVSVSVIVKVVVTAWPGAT